MNRENEICEIEGCNNEATSISKIDRILLCKKHDKGLTWDLNEHKEIQKEVFTWFVNQYDCIDDFCVHEFDLDELQELFEKRFNVQK